MTTTPTTPARVPQPRQPDLPPAPRQPDPPVILPRHPGWRPADALEALGDTYEEITATLTTLGITGLRFDPQGCPVYRYLVSLDVPVDCVDPMSVYLTDGTRVLVPDVVGEWLAEFDAHAYPALVEAVA